MAPSASTQQPAEGLGGPLDIYNEDDSLGDISNSAGGYKPYRTSSGRRRTWAPVQRMEIEVVEQYDTEPEVTATAADPQVQASSSLFRPKSESSEGKETAPKIGTTKRKSTASGSNGNEFSKKRQNVQGASAQATKADKTRPSTSISSSSSASVSDNSPARSIPEIERHFQSIRELYQSASAETSRQSKEHSEIQERKISDLKAELATAQEEARLEKEKRKKAEEELGGLKKQIMNLVGGTGGGTV